MGLVLLPMGRGGGPAMQVAPSSSLGCSTIRASSVESGTLAFQAEGGGESPTDALHFNYQIRHK